jgi:hypothetical protein
MDKGAEMNIDEMIADYDWREAFHFAQTIRTATECVSEPFSIEDVSEILKFDNGTNDEESWVMVGKLKDGRFFFLDAWCDYTGWDCQSGGDAQVANSLENLTRFGMDEKARERLGYVLED